MGIILASILLDVNQCVFLLKNHREYLNVWQEALLKTKNQIYDQVCSRTRQILEAVS